MDQLDLLQKMTESLRELGVRHALVGSMAVVSYGEPRMTRDIDLVVELDEGRVAPLCSQFNAPEYYVSREAALQAVRNRSQFNIIHIASGYKADLMIAKQDAWNRSQLERAKDISYPPGFVAPTAAPEDVILGKLWYYREGGSEKHLRDIAGMFRISGDEIDRSYIEHWAPQIGVVAEWETVRGILAPQ